MIQHSMIIDNFFIDPIRVREQLLNQEMMDYTASDNVTYPGIVQLPGEVVAEVNDNLNYLFQGRLSENKTLFARYSMESMNPPHWAHSDYEMAQFVGLIYMNPEPRPDDGTYLVKHKIARFETHPESEQQVKILLEDSNQKFLWHKTFFCPAKFNRIFIVNARYLHAAGPSYGTTKESARLVCTAFFHLK